MPRIQTAVVQSYEVGQPLPGKANPVLQWQVEQGANLEITAEAYDQGLTANFQVSSDGVSWGNPLYATSGVATSPTVSTCTATVVAYGRVQLDTITLRPGVDNYFRVSVTAGYGTIQIRGGDRLTIQTV